MDVAVASIDITPEFNVQLYGYESRKNRKTRKVLDPLYLQGIALRDGQHEFFILVFDLCLFDETISARLHAELQRLGIARDQAFISCTHTHCGPVCSYNPIFRGNPMPYIEFVIPRMHTIVEELRNHYIQDCTTSYGEGTTRVPKNRTNQAGITEANPNGDIDPVVNVVSFTTPDNELLAIIFRASVHPTLLEDIMQISADLPGSARKHLLEKLAGQMVPSPKSLPVVVFLQGFCGDANPISRGSVDILESLGNQLADETFKIINNNLVRLDAVLNYHLDYLEVPCDAGAGTKKVAAVRKALNRGKFQLVTKFTWPIHVLQIAKNTLIIGCGGEIVHEIAEMVRNIFADFNVVLVGYTGEYHVYIPAENHFRLDSYEAIGVIKYTNLAGPIDRRGLNERLSSKFASIHEIVKTW